MDFSATCCSAVQQVFQKLELSLFSCFLPATFGIEVSAVQHLFALPFKLCGLVICNPVSLASHLFNCSVAGTEHLIRSIIGFETFELDSHFDCVSSTKQFFVSSWVFLFHYIAETCHF